LKRSGPNDAGPLNVLVADGDPIAGSTIAEFLRGEGHRAVVSTSRASTLEVLDAALGDDHPFDIAIIDVAIGGGEFLREVGRRHPAAALVATSGYATVEGAVETLRFGACDYLVKPLVDAELRQTIERARRQAAILSENVSLRRRLDVRASLDSVIGTDPKMIKVLDLVRAVAPSKTTVLMTGESGTGKSMIAQAIHRLSTRRERAFVELACGSIPETLLESELFGHVKGAFTGAHADKAGRFLAANGGTIFLDEINSASPAMQLKLLRVLQERRFEPVGGTQTIEVDVRVVLASNQPLEPLVATGVFRQDLYYRINVVKIELPPLRARAGDVPLLAERILEKHASELGRQLVGFSPEALDVLTHYDYPGNVRELQNIVERAAVLAQGQVIGVEDLPQTVIDAVRKPLAPVVRIGGDDGPWVPMTLEEAMREPEKKILVKALDANGWNRQRTSEQLGINRTTLYKKMKAYGLLGDERLAG
jgi:DNA-binding NtrC family response regulator